MVDLTAEMAQLWASLGPGPSGQARVVQFVAATSGEGTSTVARELARFVSGRARKPVWLVDLDLMTAPQYTAIAADPPRYGVMGRQTAASPDGSAFFTVQPPALGPDARPWQDARYLVAHPVGGPKFWVTRFRREALRADQSVHVMPTGDYWNALRRHAELVVVDAPAADRSRSALTIAPFVDATVLVVAADEADAGGPAALRDAIHAAGGQCAGLVFNRANVSTPSFLKALLP
jgi:Mrp family chromosome partitioning ATPase